MRLTLRCYARSLAVTLCLVLATSCEPPPLGATVPAAPRIVAEINASRETVVGKTIGFGDGGDSERYRVSGWTGPERGMPFTWTLGKSARLSLPIPGYSGALTLKIGMGGFTSPPDLLFQPVTININGHRVAGLEVSGGADFEVPVPAEVANACSTLEVEFQVPKATSPSQLGHSADGRVLGVFVTNITVAPAL